MKSVNINHPTWQEFKMSYEFIATAKGLTEKYADWAADLLEEDEKLTECWYHIYGNDKFGRFVVYEFNDGFVTYVAGPMGGELKLFPTLNEALVATFADWFPEGKIGDFNDAVTQFIVGGEWIIDLGEDAL